MWSGERLIDADWVLIAPSGVLAIGGFGLVGPGVAKVVPALFALAGARGNGVSGEAVGVAATIGYAGFWQGHPLWGRWRRHCLCRWRLAGSGRFV